MNEVKIKLIDTQLPIPKYESEGAVGFDLYSRLDCTINPGQIALIPANVIVVVPEGYMLVLASRSGTPLKKGLQTPHGIGIIDNDYHGPDDELKIQVLNFTKKDVLVKKGEKIAQGIFVRIDKFVFEETDQTIKKVSRGGFGSTNKN